MIGIIGGSGFIGSNFTRIFPSTVDITREFLSSNQKIELEQLVIAAPGAKKYEINLDPNSDRDNIRRITDSIGSRIIFNELVLFSTVDVYCDSTGVDETSKVRKDLSYGGNRAFFESELEIICSNLRIRRLAGLFGKGLRKNLLFDLINNRFDQIDNYSPNSTFQYMNIDQAIEFSLSREYSRHKIMNVVSEPVKVSEITELAKNQTAKEVNYDVRTNLSSTGYLIDSESARTSVLDFILGKNH